MDLIEAEMPEYDTEELSQMSLRQLRSLMLQMGIDVAGCLEKADLLERIVSSGLVTVTRRNPPPPPPAAEGAGDRRPGWAGWWRGGETSPEVDENSSSSGTTGRTAGDGDGSRGGVDEVDTSYSVSAQTPARPDSTLPWSGTTSSLGSMSVKELKGIMARLGVSANGCLEKRDMVERIRDCGRFREGGGGGSGGRG